jgi:hypothetical protein
VYNFLDNARVIKLYQHKQEFHFPLHVLTTGQMALHCPVIAFYIKHTHTTELLFTVHVSKILLQASKIVRDLFLTELPTLNVWICLQTPH